METSHELSITFEQWQGWHIMLLAGKFVVKSIALVRKQFDEIETGQGPNVALDLREVTQMDSSALTVVLNFQKRLHQKNGTVAVIGPSEEIREMFSIVGFSMAVPVYSTRAQFEQSVRSKQ
jgi:anti-anti-sigma factor